MTEEEQKAVAALNARLAKHCACQCGEEGEIVSMCQEHAWLQSVALSNEREACAKVAEKTNGFVSIGMEFERGYDAGRADAAKAIRARSQP